MKCNDTSFFFLIIPSTLLHLVQVTISLCCACEKPDSSVLRLMNRGLTITSFAVPFPTLTHVMSSPCLHLPQLSSILTPSSTISGSRCRSDTQHHYRLLQATPRQEKHPSRRGTTRQLLAFSRVRDRYERKEVSMLIQDREVLLESGHRIWIAAAPQQSYQKDSPMFRFRGFGSSPPP